MGQAKQELKDKMVELEQEGATEEAMVQAAVQTFHKFEEEAATKRLAAHAAATIHLRAVEAKLKVSD